MARRNPSLHAPAPAEDDVVGVAASARLVRRPLRLRAEQTRAASRPKLQTGRQRRKKSRHQGKSVTHLRPRRKDRSPRPQKPVRHGPGRAEGADVVLEDAGRKNLRWAQRQKHTGASRRRSQAPGRRCRLAGKDRASDDPPTSRGCRRRKRLPQRFLLPRSRGVPSQQPKSLRDVSRAPARIRRLQLQGRRRSEARSRSRHEPIHPGRVLRRSRNHNHLQRRQARPASRRTRPAAKLAHPNRRAKKKQRASLGPETPSP